jgi:hypothetical protein
MQVPCPALAMPACLLPSSQGPFNKLPWATLTWPMWAVNAERCDGAIQSIVLDNCTLVLATGTMQYMSYWWVSKQPGGLCALC